MPHLHILEIPDDILGAALAYSSAGWYVLPVSPTTKHPGSILGRRWQDQSSRDKHVIIGWFSGSSYALALHVGRSGAVAFDVDNPSALPPVLARAIGALSPPYQLTRPDTPARGHYLFAAEPGSVGNSGGGLGTAWGEVRGLNGIIVVEPSLHSGGGEYRWERRGALPALPAELAATLRPPSAASSIATSDAVNAFVGSLPVGDSCHVVARRLEAATTALESGDGSRHEAARDAALALCSLGDMGHRGAAPALASLRDAYTASVVDSRGVIPDDRIADWNRMLSGAVGKVTTDPTPVDSRSCCDNPFPGILPAQSSDAGDSPPDVVVPAQSYFQKDGGLMVATLATDILSMGPLAEGIDDVIWAYRDGVWRSAKNIIRERAARLLGQRYRRAHTPSAEDVVRARSDRITCEPVGEVINMTNGLYYWRLDELRDHDPTVLSTVQLPVMWDPGATCPEFDRWLSQVVPADMIPVVWELIGYLMHSGNPLHKAVMLMGTGRNGKGTFLRVMDALLGACNITSVSLHDLVGTRFSTASLFGKLANIAGDIDGTYLESTATFKAITGQDMISAEHKGRDRFDFTPWAVPVFSANKIPASSDVTIGYLSRWLVILFPHDFTGREDRRLDERLQTKAELSGIAGKAMPALRRLLARGEFELPQSGRDARDEFTRRVDQVRTWTNECCEIDPGSFVPRVVLYRQYKAWASRDNYKPLRAGEFYDRLEAVPGLTQTRRGASGDRGFTGIRVIDTAEWGPDSV